MPGSALLSPGSVSSVHVCVWKAWVLGCVVWGQGPFFACTISFLPYSQGAEGRTQTRHPGVGAYRHSQVRGQESKCQLEHLPLSWSAGTTGLSIQSLRAQVRVQERLLRAGVEALTEAGDHYQRPYPCHQPPQNWCHITGPVSHLANERAGPHGTFHKHILRTHHVPNRILSMDMEPQQAPAHPGSWSTRVGEGAVGLKTISFKDIKKCLCPLT